MAAECGAAALIGSASATGAYALLTLGRAGRADEHAAERCAAVAALGGGSALALSTSWHGLAPLLIPTQGYPLRAYALRSVVLYTTLLPPVIGATVWALMAVEGVPRARYADISAQVLGSTWILAAGCQSAYHMLLEKRSARVLAPAVALAGLLQWSMVIGTIRQDWSERGLEARGGRTSISRWRVQSAEQVKLPVAVAIKQGSD
ncbi:hypothetical protein KFE25_007755 [Diacronema lutheri]|uniref:Uncharacterized protein n=1 Tax=Diacronema lutheri TaxID=2081491 RepID=A0A8J6CBW1_DIALT|nr:hypothetical protein KFE25_007755 [Diacronema lutheri]